MLGILADVNCTRHLELLIRLCQSESRREFWTPLNLRAFTLSDLNLPGDAPDRLIWQRCQAHQLVLLTANRNAKDETSLELAIRDLNTSASLPVITIADEKRLGRDRRYTERAADRFLEYLFDIHKYLGTGRLFIP